ncbi:MULTISPECIES: hypothetical protein [Methylococcus]|uniref:Uncharacterized protein n=1 Tax=Methylococcus capsulatus TaxID=414 RepID=A0ABZ2F107_METCP|nr:hypothetical protein [Methylococcus sp. BF19-07]
MHTNEHFGKGGSYVLNPETDQIELTERTQTHVESEPGPDEESGSHSGAGTPAPAVNAAEGQVELETAIEPAGAVEAADAALDRPARRSKKTDGEQA